MFLWFDSISIRKTLRGFLAQIGGEQGVIKLATQLQLEQSKVELVDMYVEMLVVYNLHALNAVA